MTTSFKTIQPPVDLEACPFCGKRAVLKKAHGSGTYRADAKNVASYKHKVGPVKNERYGRSTVRQYQNYEWDVFTVGCSKLECLGNSGQRFYSMENAIEVWNRRA